MDEEDPAGGVEASAEGVKVRKGQRRFAPSKG